MSTAANLQKQDAPCHRTPAFRRWGALLGGGALAVYGLSRRSLSGVAIAGAGGALAYAGIRASSVPREIAAHATMILNCSSADAYQFWRKLENVSLFMSHVDAVTQVGERRYRWEVSLAGSRTSGEVEIVNDRENQEIAWRSIPGEQIGIEGSVEFRFAPGNRGTLLDVKMRYVPLSGGMGRALVQAFAKYPEFLLRQDLRRFKALVETGEIPTIEGQTHGPRSTKIAALRVADPSLPIRPESNLKQIFRAMRRIA